MIGRRHAARGADRPAPAGPEGGEAARTAARTALGLSGLVLTLLGTAPPAPAQVTAERAASSVRYHHIGLVSAAPGELESVSLLTVPVATRAALGDRITVELGGYWARGEVERSGGGTSTVAALTDATLTASVELGDGLATVSAVGRLPTGRTEYGVGELDVVGAISSDLFPFRISHWGTGGGVGGRVSTSRQVGAFGTALSVGYYHSGRFDPIEDRLVGYQPGDRLSVRAVVSAPIGRAGQLALQGGFRRFGDDEVDGDGVFQTGNRYDAVANFSFAVGSDAAGFVYGGYRRRSAGRRLQLREPTASQDMLVAGGGLRLRAGDVLVRPTADARLIDRADDASEGYGLRAGATAEWPVGGATLLPVLRADLGSVTVRDGVESGFLGVEVGLGVRLGGDTQ